MIAKLHEIGARATQRRTLPLEVEARLTESLFRHLGSLVAGHVAGLVLAALAIKDIGGTSFLVFSAAFATLGALRAFVFYKARRTPDLADPRHIIR